MFFAACWYVEDQDSPSNLFVLKLDGVETREEITKALLAYVKLHTATPVDADLMDDEELYEPCLSLQTSNDYAEFSIEHNGGWFFASSENWPQDHFV